MTSGGTGAGLFANYFQYRKQMAVLNLKKFKKVFSLILIPVVIKIINLQFTGYQRQRSYSKSKLELESTWAEFYQLIASLSVVLP